MPPGYPNREEIDRFLFDEIDSVPQLEALLLMWRYRPRKWSCEEIACDLYISTELAAPVLAHLVNHGFIQADPNHHDLYELNLESEERQKLLSGLEDLYRRELVRISNFIHAKASRAVRDFASAFRFKKDDRK